MEEKSLDIKQNLIDRLKEFAPNVFTEDNKIDIEKLKLLLGDDFNIENERYVLNWAGKSDAFKALQTPTTATLAPAKDESINFDTTENIFIEGENLEVLKVLQKSYFGKIKMIYIDPPYNTGNDSFIYPDKYSETKDEYLKRIGEKDEEGYMLKEGLFRKNSKESGRYHSNWLSMMYPRLFLARNLLRDDGVIFVSIDDNEVHNLRMIMNEIFGEENFVVNLIWLGRSGKGGTLSFISNQHEHILLYGKKIEELSLKTNIKVVEGGAYEDQRGKYKREQLRQWGQGDRKEDRPSMFFPIVFNGIEIFPKRNDGSEGRWRFGNEKVNQMIELGDLDFVKSNDEWVIYRKIREGKQTISVTDSVLKEVGTSATGTIEIKTLFNDVKVFDTSKPSSLITYLINLGIPEENDDIILDFFAGSGSTAQAVLNLNKDDRGRRKFILVQLPEKIGQDSEAYKAGYKTIADIGKERIGRVIKNLELESKNQQTKISKDKEKKLDLGFKVFKLKNSNFKLWRGDVIDNGEDLEKQIDAFEDPVKKEAEEENIVYELLLKLGYDLYVRVEKQGVCIDGIGKVINGIYTDTVSGNFKWWEVEGGKMIIVTDADMPITNLLNHLKGEKIKPEKIIALDRIFEGHDESKTNLVLQMRDAGGGV